MFPQLPPNAPLPLKHARDMVVESSATAIVGGAFGLCMSPFLVLYMGLGEGRVGGSMGLTPDVCLAAATAFTGAGAAMGSAFGAFRWAFGTPLYASSS